MGLDWVPIHKPKEGQEEIFNQTLIVLSGDYDDAFLQDKEAAKLEKMSTDDLWDFYESISISPAVSIGAPTVGESKEADKFIKQRYEKKVKKDPEFAKDFATLDSFLKYMKGYHVLELVEISPGIPYYQTTVQQIICFRAKFLNDTEEILGNDLYEQAFDNKLAPADAISYGQKLMEKAEKFATENNCMQLKNRHDLPTKFQHDSKESKAHILFSAANWIFFWANKGHGYRADQ